MIRVFRFDGKEIFINPDNVMFVELREGFGGPDTTDVTMIDGKTHSFSATTYEILSGAVKKAAKPGFDTNE